MSECRCSFVVEVSHSARSIASVSWHTVKRSLDRDSFIGRSNVFLLAPGRREGERGPRLPRLEEARTGGKMLGGQLGSVGPTHASMLLGA